MKWNRETLLNVFHFLLQDSGIIEMKQDFPVLRTFIIKLAKKYSLTNSGAMASVMLTLFKKKIINADPLMYDEYVHLLDPVSYNLLSKKELLIQFSCIVESAIEREYIQFSDVQKFNINPNDIFIAFPEPDTENLLRIRNTWISLIDKVLTNRKIKTRVDVYESH